MKAKRGNKHTRDGGTSLPEEGGETRRVIVLGGGSAGYLAALALKIRLPRLEVTVIHSRAIPVIGVGEGTTFTVPIFLHGYLGLDPGVFHRLARPTYKLGIRFLWGPRERFFYTFTPQLDGRLPECSKANGFYAGDSFEYGDIQGALMAAGKGFERQPDGGPLVTTAAAYHVENEEFVAFLERAAAEAGIVAIDDEVESVETGEAGVAALRLRSGRSARADLYVDCSGFRSELLGRALGEPFDSFRSSLFCDRAVAGGWPREEEPLLPYTTAETMDAGWAWQIEHDRHINRGYVYSSDFLSDEEAEREFRAKNPKVKNTRVIRFASGAYRRSWVKNVVALGNASGFVEPLEATSLSVICDHSVRLVQALADADMAPGDQTRRYYNQYASRNWRAIRRFLALHYKFNTRVPSPFWNACQESVDLAGAEDIVDYYRDCGPSLMWAAECMGQGDPFGWEGYLVMLVGQGVPWRRRGTLAPEEQERWAKHCRELGERARQGLELDQALAMIRSDRWTWKPDFYQKAVRW